MAHPLDDAYLRVERASEHLKELKTLHGEVCVAQAHAMTIKYQPNVVSQTLDQVPLAKLIDVQTGTTPIPPKCRLLIGDIANDLRSALDYTVRQLAEHDSGKKITGTQFPIVGSPKAFKKRRKTYLRGVNTAHVAAIEKLQPYKGCQWTEPLARMSNLDKHNELVTVTHDCLVTTEVSTESPADSEIVQASVKVYLQPILRITLGNLPVIETLETIQSQVTKTLDAFEPEF